MLSNKVLLPTTVRSSNMNRTLPFDKTYHLGHRILRWNRDKHVHMLCEVANYVKLSFIIP